jgi:hypothetical protein
MLSRRVDVDPMVTRSSRVYLVTPIESTLSAVQELHDEVLFDEFGVKREISDLFDFYPTHQRPQYSVRTRDTARRILMPQSVRIMRCGWTIVVIDQYTCTFVACVLKRNYLLAAAQALGD